MTTTHTFQGLNTENKPSSRVLNPPGGSSSNIFGGFEEQPQQQPAGRNSSGNVSQGNVSVSGQGQNATAGSQQKSRPPRSGDDSFHNLFGNYLSSAESDKIINRVNSPVKGTHNQVGDQPQRFSSRRHCKSPDTFFNIFGNERIERRRMFRSVLNDNKDSFLRLFGHPGESTLSQEVAPSNSALYVNNTKSEDCTQSSSMSTIPSSLNQSYLNNAVARENKTDGEDKRSSSISQNNYENSAVDKTLRRHRRFSDRGAFNPITGESYDEPKSRQGSLPSFVNSSETASSKTVITDAGKLDASKSSSSNVDPVLDKSEPKEEKPQPAEQEKFQPIEQEKSQNTEQAIPEPSEQGKSEPTATSVPAPPTAQQRKQQQLQSGVFGGGVEDVKEHRSTRVSQPPGGRSTKLW